MGCTYLQVKQPVRVLGRYDRFRCPGATRGIDLVGVGALGSKAVHWYRAGLTSEMVKVWTDAGDLIDNHLGHMSQLDRFRLVDRRSRLGYL